MASLREAFKNYLADFVHLGGTPLPYPLNGHHFPKKTLAEIRLKMGQKGQIIVQKGLKMHEKRQKKRVFGPKKPAI